MKDRIIFFDGDCALCDSFVGLILKIDKNNAFSFAPLQGKTAKELIKDPSLKGVDSVILFESGNFLVKSDAVLEIMKRLGFPWSTLWVFKVIPKFIRDVVYDFVAKNRIKVFGKKNSCKLPTPEERRKILN